jgi:hypothetical protein
VKGRKEGTESSYKSDRKIPKGEREEEGKGETQYIMSRYTYGKGGGEAIHIKIGEKRSDRNQQH